MKFLRVVGSTAKITFTSQLRYFSWMGFVLRSFPVFLNLGVAWVLYNTMFAGKMSAGFQTATNSSDYFSFVLVGSVFFVYVVSSLFSVGRAMYWESVQGTIDALFMSPMNRVAYMLGITVGAIAISTIDFTMILFFGYVLGFRVQYVDITLLIIGLLLMLFSLFGLGLMVNAVTLTLRDRTSTANTMTVVLLVFSGTVCPIGLMPEWAQVISWGLPFFLLSRCFKRDFDLWIRHF